MKRNRTPAQPAKSLGKLLEINEALVIQGVRQHELKQELEDLNGQLLLEVAKRRRVEDEILELNQQLEQRVLSRTTDLQASVIALEAEIANRLRLEREVLEVSEREQCRVGQDLHDGLGQELAGIAMLSEVHAKRLHGQSHPSFADAEKIASYVRAALETARRLAKGYFPIELKNHGLLPTLQTLAHQITGLTGIHCGLVSCGVDPQLNDSVKIHIYRIIQECIGNAIKHASPTRIEIGSAVDETKKSVMFSVTDDGVGLPHGEFKAGMGIRLTAYRAGLIGAEIHTGWPAEGGCRVVCRVPL